MAGVRPRLLILVGVRGSGKTTLGASLAETFPLFFFQVEPVLQENLRKSNGLSKSELSARGYQRILAQLIELSKLHSLIAIESTGTELSNELAKYKRFFNVMLVRVRAPLEVCLARANIRDKAGGEELDKSNQISQNLNVEWSLTFENLDPIPTNTQIRQLFSPLLTPASFSSTAVASSSSSSTSTTSSSSSSALPSSSASSSSSSASCAPAILHTVRAPVTLGSNKHNRRGEPRSCLKNKSEQPRRGIQWDEPNLQQNEDEKVPRMKIDEPKTPFNYIDAEDEGHEGPAGHTPTFDFANQSDSDEAMAPRRRGSYSEGKGAGLGGVDLAALATQAIQRREAEWEESDDASDDFMTFKERKLEQQRQQEFEEKRKNHYNMGSLLKRQKPPVEEDEEEDEEEQR